MPSHTLHVDGHTLIARAFNPEADGTPIILLHGITASLNYWTLSQRAPFVAHGPCYALSLPGHYPARFPADHETGDITAAAIAHTLAGGVRELLGARPVVLAGHSTGGFAALDVAAHHPELARAVVSIAGFAHGRWTGALGFAQRLARGGAVGRRLFKLTYAANRATRWGQKASWIVYAARPRQLFRYPQLDEVFGATYPNYKRLDLDAMADYFARMPEIDIGAQLGTITAPTLVITGDRDPIVPPAQAHLIAARVPHATLAVLPDAGHIPAFEATAAYEDALRTWLQDVLPRPTPQT